MLVSIIPSINPYSTNVIPASAGSARANAPNPSFGYRYIKWAARIVDKYLPTTRRKLFDGELLDAVNSPNPKKATNRLMTKAFFIAFANMVVTTFKQATHYIGSIVI